jgi:hypothetical protein
MLIWRDNPSGDECLEDDCLLFPRRRGRRRCHRASICRALVVGLAHGGDAIDEQPDEVRLPHLARKCTQRGGVLGGGSMALALAG